MQLIKTVIFSTIFSMSLFSQNRQKVLVCYGKFDVNIVKGYDLIILESAHFNIYEVKKLKQNNKKILAYISLGEVNEVDQNYQQLKNYTLGKNNDWNSHYLDLASTKTVEVLNRDIQKILFMGYDGLFLDNIDNFNSFGPQFNQQKLLLEYIEKLKSTHPSIYIIQNAGIELIEKTRQYVDGMLIESVASNFTFEDKKYKLREQTDYIKYINDIKEVSIKNKISIILIEYADTKKLAKKLEERLKLTKFPYYISDINLQKLPYFK
jgi:polysaccharide biosynthesis protein PelA